MTGTPTPAAVIGEARRWIGTPYVHQQSVKGAGTDCLGVVRGVWRAFYGEEPEAPPPYSRDWAERHGRETMMDTFDRYLHRHDPDAWHYKRGNVLPLGGVVLFRFVRGGPAKHAAIVSGPDSIIHAYEGARAVMECGLPMSWRRRIAAAYSFPMGGV